MEIRKGNFAVHSRSYVVEVDGKLITRNRKSLRTTSESLIVMPEFDISTYGDNDYSPNQDRKVNTSNQRVFTAE